MRMGSLKDKSRVPLFGDCGTALALIAVVIVLAFWLVCKYSDKIDKFIKEKLKLKK